LIYIISFLIYVLFFLLFTYLHLKTKDIIKRKNKLYNLEQNLIWNLPKVLKISFALLPNITKNFLYRYKDSLIESQLIEVFNELIPASEGGISCFETLESISSRIKEPLRNELSYFIILSKNNNIKNALEYKFLNTKNIFLKQFWQILYRYLLSGGIISSKLNDLKKSIMLKINIRKKIKTRLLNNKIQMILSVVVPYFMFIVLNLIIPNFFLNLINSKLGIIIVLISMIFHSIGILIFIKISKFNSNFDFNKAIFINYITFSLENGISFYDAFKEIYYLLGLKKINLENKTSTYELLELLDKFNDNEINSFTKILKKNLEYGISCSKSLNNLYIHIMEKIEYKITIFEQKLPALSLIPLFIFIFPATYILILSPIIVELFK